ncbi:Ubiquitination network signaling protein acrB [Paramyrothecium foliicola]|nr:Ubiquitination network signaling protein acrB [Paramyrothecium foliicola]
MGPRVTGKKSQGQLDGSARPVDHAAGHAGSSQLHSHSGANGHGNGVPKNYHHDSISSNPNDAPRRSSVAEFSETSSESCTSHLGNGTAVVEGSHRQIDVNAMKNADVHRDSGPFELAATVLKSLPMQDTLAILIILMHVPSLSLSVIYTIFTFLTFVPPVTTSSGMNINFAEIFDGNSTMPSLVTVLCMDFFFLLVWLFLWQPMQDTILDFAKPVIAITLGGGTSARDGTSRGVTTCFTWVLLHHLIRGTRVHWSRLASHIPEHWRLPSYFNESFGSNSLLHDKRSANSWVRSVLAIHILTQGMVRYIREWYLKREKVNASSGASDPEVGKLQAAVGDGAHDAGFNTPESEAWTQPTLQPSTTKKKRKQSAQVRLQQPLWAALASTKIVVMKEYELSHAASESAGSNATDIHNLGNAPFDRQPGQIWISYIGSDEVCFSTSSFPELAYDAKPAKQNGHEGRPSGIDTTKPFYVRVNDAFWQPTRIFPIDDSSDNPQDGPRFTGDIYGLRPASKYVCEFVDTQTDEVLFSTSIRTAQELQRETDGPAPAVPDDQQPRRPDSPATTLKTSIAAAEAKLADEKNRLKTLRKEWKARINALKKDNELTDNQLSSAGNHDEKYKQKIRQQETQKAQAERDTERLADQLKNFDTAPELGERKKKMERAYNAEKKVFDAAQKSFKEHKTRLENEVKVREVEKSNLNTRRNKIATRIAKVENELANITDANNRGLDEAERRNQERGVWQEHIAGIESNYHDRLALVRTANATRSEHIRNAQTQLNSFHEYMNSANGMPYDMADQGPAFQQPSTWNPNPAAPPHFPTSMWTNSSTDLAPSMTTTAGPSSIPLWQPPPTAPPFEPRVSKSRGRSSSMLSDISGFTQSSEEDTSSPIGMQLPSRLWAADRLRKEGSMRSSGSGSSGEPYGEPNELVNLSLWIWRQRPAPPDVQVVIIVLKVELHIRALAFLKLCETLLSLAELARVPVTGPAVEIDERANSDVLQLMQLVSGLQDEVFEVKLYGPGHIPDA